LDRRQWIFDFMRNPASNIGPGRCPLRRHKLGNVVKRNDITVLRVGRSFRCHPDIDRPLAATSDERDRSLNAQNAFPRLLDKSCNFRNGLDDRMADCHRFALADQTLCRTIENIDTSLGIEADDTRAYAREHRLGKSPPFVDLVARAHDIVALRSQFLRHGIETVAEAPEIAFRAPHRHLHEKIA
jgi:hypothetical protein